MRHTDVYQTVKLIHDRIGGVNCQVRERVWTEIADPVAERVWKEVRDQLGGWFQERAMGASYGAFDLVFSWRFHSA